MKITANKIVSSIFTLMLIANCYGEHGGIEISGGKPIIIAFPVGCENLLWMEKDFNIKTTIYRDVESGLVTGVWLITGKGGSWADNNKVKEMLEDWKLPFLKSIISATKKWQFQKTKAVRVDPDVGGVLGKSIGRDFTFRFIRNTNGMFKTQITDDSGIVGDDMPSL